VRPEPEAAAANFPSYIEAIKGATHGTLCFALAVGRADPDPGSDLDVWRPAL